ncbi:DUF2157 domain-containing protein [Cyclobacterium jeungdonense]|uniref:DUF2157 domain-containing protein n=1 Tax=Cyclobacterium jeungdonense TaxID=708087 RepID=A0ABT8C3A1_9BACT|nr:DUF2157 domain-containing protein [Cyclobacterium jeungdonense]MDN3686990.1 DUF2157 domain-containing protein [Cyclobacterium jeungdonense]
MNLLKDLPELKKAGVITQETADNIQAYYKSKNGSSTNRLLIVFGVLGAVLVGLGIMLIVAHNWDELSRGTKTIVAFLPLLTGQLLCGYVLIKRLNSVTWRESATSFLFFSIGASIALVSQIYNIPGGTGSFLLTWMLLCFPLIYLMRSSITSLLFISGITYYASHQSYWSYPSSDSYLYWLLLLGVLPHYYQLYMKKPESNYMIFHNWMIPLSVVISLGTVAKETEELMFIAYFSLFGLLFLIGNLDFFTQQKSRNNGYKILGSLGTIALLLILSFNGFWENLRKEHFLLREVIVAPEFIASALTSLLVGAVVYLQYKNKALNEYMPIAGFFILFILIFILGFFSPMAVILINSYVLALGTLIISNGAKKDHLGIVNYGLLVITALVICRFFDTNLSFVLRGIMFVSVGTGFFVANYWMLKKRNSNG